MTVPVDTHVHLYPCFPVRDFLDTAARNFADLTGQPPAALEAALLLADPAGDDSFARLQRFARSDAEQRGGWTLGATDETFSLLARHSGGACLLLVAGRQVITAERLELLALGTVAPLSDGQTLADSIARARDAGALPVVAWGVGKWLGSRGDLLRTTVDADPDGFCLGDNAGRPWPWPRPAVMKRTAGRPLLAGSDPFPFIQEMQRIGRYGVLLPGRLAGDHPAATLLDALWNGKNILHYGRQLGIVAFLRNFVRLRQRRRARAGVEGHREVPDIVTSSDDYARRFSGAAGPYLLETQAASVERVLDDKATSVLELGGGHGQLAAQLRRHYGNLYELGSANSCHARLRATADPAMHCITGDLLRMPFKDSSVDLVVAVRLLPHIEDWPQLIAECCRVARRSVVLDYPSLVNLNLLAPLLFQVKKRFETNTRPYLSFYQFELAREFRRQGFRVTRRAPQFFLPMALHRLTGAHPVMRGIERLCARSGLTHLLGSPVILRADRI